MFARAIGAHGGSVKTFEFELVRTIDAPIEQVFARLIDIEGYNDWMPKRGTLMKETHQTSPGEPTVGTTYVDDARFGSNLPGDIAELEAPYKVVYHWWDKTKGGKLKSEGYPGFHLEAAGPNQTVVRHTARLHVHGANQLLMPLFRRLAVRERTTTIDALQASFAAGDHTSS